jgi:hypothetical protein
VGEDDEGGGAGGRQAWGFGGKGWGKVERVCW